METLIHAGLMNAVFATVLAVIVAGLSLLCRRRPAVVHALWVLVLVKFLVPSFFPVEIPFWRPSPAQPDDPVPVASQEYAAPETAPFDENQHLAGDFSPERATPELLPPEIFPPAEQSSALASADLPVSADLNFAPIVLSWEELAGLVWLTGSLTWMAVAAVRIVRFQRVLRLAKPIDPKMRLQVRQLAERLGLSIFPSVAFVSAPITPLLWALTRPRLLIPSQLWKRLNEEQRDTLLVHELAHLRRGDHWVRRLEMVVLALYWWHPVVWWAQRQLREAEEQCCDAWVLWALPEAAPNYAVALVETLAFLCHSRPTLPLGASGIEPMRLLKRRLSMIVQGHTPRRMSRPAFWAVVGLGLLLLPLVPVPAQQTGNPEGADEEQIQPLEPPASPPSSPQLPASKPAPTLIPPPIGAHRAEQIEAARDQVDLMEAKLMIKRAELEELEKRIRLAQRNVKRFQELFEKGVMTEAALIKARDEAELLPTQLPTKKAELKEAEIMLKQAQRRLGRLEAAEPPPTGSRPGMGPPPAGQPGMMAPSGPPTMAPKRAPMKGPGGPPPRPASGAGTKDGKALPGAPVSGMPGRMGPSLPGVGGKGSPGLPSGPGVGQPPTGGASLPAGPGAGAPPMPPSDGAEGMVLETDPKSGLVTISIGSDSGLKKGSALYVYRLKPNPKYSGTIEIVQTQPHQAVGRLAIAHSSVEKGDLVAGMGDANGFVLDSDPNTGLTTISIGTNSGIKPGSILEVYSLRAPNPKYMGKIEILEAQENSALGRKTLAPPTNPLEEGDLVVNKMIGKAGDTAAAPKPTSSWANSLFENKSWEFGPVRRGEKLGHTFQLTNRLDKPIHIASVRSSAGYLTPRLVVKVEGGAQARVTETWLGPYQSAAVDVSVDTGRFLGDKTANIFVQFDQPSIAQVQLQVHVRSIESPAGTAVKGEPEESKARILELEQKIDQLLKQMDSLRDDLKHKPAKPGSGSSRIETVPGTGIQRNSSQPTVEEPAKRK
jgi:beta-lactamase regulating signal transducer with metallopeptidase domain